MVEIKEREYSYPLLTDEHASGSAYSSTYSATDIIESTVKRTGTIWTAITHIITGVIGSGVLSLAWSVAQLGWIAGPLAMVVFGIITIITSNLLCDCYRFPDPEVGHVRHKSYTSAVKSYLGKKNMWVVGIFLQESFYGYGIAYTITAAISMRAIMKSNCYHKYGHDAQCEYGDSLFMLLFGAVEVVFSQIPDFHNMLLLSVMAAVMSVAYASMGLGLGFAKVLENREVRGDAFGVTASTLPQKVWLSAQALGDIAFAFTFHVILIDIQDTLKAPPAENKTMKKASTVGLFITTCFFLLCGCFGYAAFGDQTPGNLLTGFGFYEPYWLVDFANACIVLHLVGGYQMYSQPLFGVVERKIQKKYPDSRFVNNECMVKLPLVPQFRVNFLRLCFRTAYVTSTTIIALLFPYFNQVLGVLGAVNFYPLAIYFPIELYMKQNSVRAWTGTWIVLQGFRIFCLLFTILSFIGSLEGVVTSKLS